MEAVLNGDTSAFALLVRKYERAAMSAVFGVLRDHHAAQDVVQDVFVTAYEELGKLRNRNHFGAWVLRIAYHRGMRVARERPSQPQPSDVTKSVASPENGRIGPETQDVLQAISQLPMSERAVVQLRFFGKQTVDQIAETTDCPVGTVTKQLSRAYARLRRLLKESDCER